MGDWFPLAPNQLDVWFDQALHPDQPSYNIGGYLDCRFAADVPALIEAFRGLARRHESLRLEICVREDGRPWQRVQDAVDGTPRVIDLRSERRPMAAALQWMNAEMNRVFDLDRAPCFAAAVLILGGRRRILFLKCHHLVADGWSFALLNRDLCRIFAAGAEPAREPHMSYRAFVDESRAYLESPAYGSDVAYWQSTFPSVPPEVLPHRGSADDEPSGKIVVRLPRPFYERLDALGEDPSVTAFHAILAALHAALAGHHRNEGLVVGLPVLNRAGAARRGTAGLFVKAIPFRVRPEPAATVSEALRGIAAHLREAYRHHRCPLRDINRSAGLGATGRTRLFDLTLSFERHDHEGAMAGQRVIGAPLTHSSLRLPLAIFVREFAKSEAVHVEFLYRPAHLPHAEAYWLAKRVRANLAAFVRDPKRRLATLPLLAAGERRALAAWNRTGVDLARGRTVVDLFAEQVRARPRQLALVEGDATAWTYETLAGRVERLAARLASLGWPPGTRIGVALERGADLAIAMLAVLTARMAYLPLGTQLQPERLAHVLAEAQVRLVLASEPLPAAGLDGAVDAWHPAVWSDPAPSPERPRVLADDVACVIYTSGSTGRPKGVVLEHGALANMILALAGRYTDETSRVLQFAAPTFDASVHEVLGTLCRGATLHVPPQRGAVLPDAALVRFLRERRVTLATLPPAVLAALPADTLPDLATVISAGDTCPAEVVARWANGRTFVNAYGPTEATVCATSLECAAGDPRPPIGRPIANVRVHVVDEAGREVAIGAEGEIAIGGMGVGRGYLGRPDLDARAFVRLPGLGRVYRTGDRGRWRADGVVEHLGRIDRQAKIRGSRVDPGEVEAALRTHLEVRDAAVIVRGEAPHQWLAAYVTPSVPAAELRQHLVLLLPPYMVPARIFGLASLPLSAHGKVDFDALPHTEPRPTEAAASVPRDALDQRLLELWAKVLAVEAPGIDDDFFEFGGDSLKSAVLGNEIERALGINLPMAILFERPTVRALADMLREMPQGESLAWPILLAIRPRGSEPPLFCVPGANASGFYLHMLAGELPAPQPFYALQLPGYAPGTEPLATVEALAALHHAHIRQACPRGPVRLAGHSFGGVIAFEVARRMEAAGEDVDSLIVFDTTLTQDGDRAHHEDVPESAFLGDMLEVCGWDPAPARALQVTPEGALLDGPEVLALVRRFLVARSLLPGNCTDAQLRRVIAIWRAVAAAHEVYRPANAIRAPIALFLATELPTNVVRKDERPRGWGWERWTTGGLAIEWVPGNHVEMLNPPYVAEVGRRLTRMLLPPQRATAAD